MDRIRQMQVFIQVMESGSFSKAAEALNLPRSTISTVIQTLEDRLHAQLFQRTTRRVMPTHDGLNYLETAREIVDAFEAAEMMFRQGSGQVSGRLRVDMPSRIGRRFIIPALPSLLQAHPELELEISTRDRIADMIPEGIDCLIRVGSPGDPLLVCSKLGELELVNCASQLYLAHYGAPKTLADLGRHVMVGYSHDATPLQASAGLEYLDRRGLLQSAPMQSLVSVDNAEAYIASALAGLGIIQVPRFDVQHLLDAGELVQVLPEFQPLAMQLSFLYAKRRNLPARIRVFQVWVSQLLRPLIAPCLQERGQQSHAVL